ncbi:hypothetical protein X732_30470 [Mesorhizobium sp. L2C066B000]|nr:hypothetical protein X732_30470 [Mesorhizobium sp. L2C066B000]
MVLIASSVAPVLCAQEALALSTWGGCLQPIPSDKEEFVMTQLRQRIREDMEVRNFALNTQISYL